MDFLSILTRNKNLVISVIMLILIAGTGIYIKVLKSERDTARAEKVTLSAELTISKNSVKDLQSAIDTQNAAIAKMKNDADVRQATHISEINAAKQVASTYKKQAQTLMKSIPESGMNKCEAANQLINGELKK